MALHDPVEDALNDRKRRARQVEAGGAFSPNTLDVTNQFLGTGGTEPAPSPIGSTGIVPSVQPPIRQFVGPSGRGLPGQASATARSRFGGQQTGRRVRRPGVPTPIRQPATGGTLADRFFNLPEPANFSRTPQGQQLLQRVLGRGRGFR